MRIVIILIAASLLSASLSSCIRQTVSGEDGEVLYSKTIRGNPWESEERQTREVEAQAHELGVYGR